MKKLPLQINITLVALLWLVFSFQVRADDVNYSNRLFDWAEVNYPQYFSPPKRQTMFDKGQEALYRYYENTDTYLATTKEHVYVHGKVFNGWLHVGKIEDFIPRSKTNDFSKIDKSQSFTRQIQQIFSQFTPNDSFYDVKIKHVSHPAKFIGSWTMWDDFRADKTTLNADGSCSEEYFYYKKGKAERQNCMQWFHITLEKNNTAFLLFVYENYVSIVSYEWNDNNNIYFHYTTSNKGHLATRVNSSPFAQPIEARFFFGTWLEDTTWTQTYWTFDANHQFSVKTYMTEDNKLVADEVGTWSINKKQLKITVPANKKDGSFLAKSLPPNDVNTLDYYKGTDTLSFEAFYRSFSRYSEPLMISTDPFIGKFQAHETYRSRNAMSLNIFHKGVNNYEVDIFWNNSYFLKNKAQKINDNLHVTTKYGVLIFKPIINGIQKINILKDNAFNFKERILRTSQDPMTIAPNLIGSWVQSVHYSIPEKFRYFTFLEDGRYIHRNSGISVNIGHEGTYRKENDKIYFKSLCSSKEYVETIKFNEAHFNSSSYGTAAFVKIKQSSVLNSFYYALKQYKNTYKKREIGLIPSPKKQGAFLFAAESVYKNLGIVNMHFSPDGTMFTYYPTSQGIIYNDYYIETAQGVEKIVLLKSSTNPLISSNSKPLKLYNGRRTICSANLLQLGLE